MMKRIQKLGTDQSGMTLIDICIFLVVISLLTVPLIKAYDAWTYSNAYGVTTNNESSVNKAMGDYYYQEGRYPCPARIDAQPDDPDYGTEDCTGTTLANNTRVGSIPFATLKIPASYALDGWQNKLTYVVAPEVSPQPMPPAGLPANITTSLVRERFLPADNIAGVNVECPGTMDTPAPNYHFFIISHGPRGVGATNAEGNVVRACSADGVTRESENCDNDTRFLETICARSDTNNANYYDDLVMSDNSLPSRMWVYSTAPAADPTDIVSTITQIGINNDNPFNGTTETGVDVRGNVLAGNGTANTGIIISDNLCDNVTGANCFPPNLLTASATTTNDCNFAPGGTFMRGIWGGPPDNIDKRSGARIRCQNSFFPSTSSTPCVSPKYAIGFSGGKVRCSP